MKKNLTTTCCLLSAWVTTVHASAQTKIVGTGSPGSGTRGYSFEPLDVIVITFVASAFYFLFFKRNSER